MRGSLRRGAYGVAALFAKALAGGINRSAFLARQRGRLGRGGLGGRDDRPAAAPTKPPACRYRSPTTRAISIDHLNVPGA
jgi:hypothetical protein